MATKATPQQKAELIVKVAAVLAKGSTASQRIDNLLGLPSEQFGSEDYELALWSWCQLHLNLTYQDVLWRYTTQELCALIERAIEAGAPPIHWTSDTTATRIAAATNVTEMSDGRSRRGRPSNPERANAIKEILAAASNWQQLRGEGLSELMRALDGNPRATPPKPHSSWLEYCESKDDRDVINALRKIRDRIAA